MKKYKKSFLIAGIVLGLTALTAAAAGTWNALSQPTPQQPGAQVSVQRSADSSSETDPVYQYLAANYSGDALYEKTDEYARLKMVYQPETEEIQQMASLLEGGADFGALMESYRFWITTNADFTLVEQLTNAYTPELAQVRHWTENVYDALCANSGLTTQEVQDYLDGGRTQDDIMLANELSRKNVYSIQELLDKRGQNKSWFEIVSGVWQGLGAELDVPRDKGSAYRDIADGYDVVQAVFLSTRSGKTLEVWLDLAAQGHEVFASAVSDYHTELVREELQRLKPLGLYAVTGGEAAAEASQDAYLTQQIQAQGVDMQEVQALQEQGHDAAEILSAAIEANQSGQPLALELEQ